MRQSTFRNIAHVVLACAALAACDAPQVVNTFEPTSQVVPGVMAAAPVEERDAFARQFLNGIQASSIAQSRELCGYFVLSRGQLIATPPRRGTEASCDYGPIPIGTVASYHTHGSYGAQYDNEVPSGFDLISAIDVQFDDYVSTPGGRLWRVDGKTGTATQLCGLGCLVSDPNFVPRDEGNVRPVYTVATLRRRQEL
ncbi:protein of unknown function [Cognatiyoonia koreensis]|uniref:DUF4329 domain-containing protein n=1 Tax=Cognatiyoonia koreensis TaxID=364200 RepID=A0A1I0PM60_9RHOB|nr:DUF4329 domain-containing protein [Cognatiyoonia koreensis]SEW15433.1 protein of unknown function [Cognatiyoonia koreensis]